MDVITGLKPPPSLPKNTIVTIGNFDGVHLGHQKILLFLVDQAKKRNLYSLVLTFSPHPEEILSKGKIVMIQTLTQRLKTIEKFGVHGVLVTPFDEQFSNLSSEEFIQKILLNSLKAKEIVIGDNFRFGKNREGGINALQALAPRLGFEAHKIPSVIEGGKIVSSSLIRRSLLEGEIEEANTLLGRYYEIKGNVIKGKARGKVLGFPTANIEAKNDIIPLGVYISQVRINSETLPAITNAGLRPTFDKEEMQIESYIINFNRNLYGEEIDIIFINKIRDEMKFKSPEELSLQISKDLEQAKTYFKLI